MYIFNLLWTWSWPPRGSCNAEPGPKLFKDPLWCHNCKKGRSGFYNISQFITFLFLSDTNAARIYILSSNLLYLEILIKDLRCFGGLFWFWGSGASFRNVDSINQNKMLFGVTVLLYSKLYSDITFSCQINVTSLKAFVIPFSITRF
jgi:hypothetical protein